MSDDVFISYSHEDVDLAKRLYSVVSHEFAVFWDENLLGGEIFSDRLIREIDRIPVFLLVWSSASSRSEWVNKEYREADKKKKIIIPLKFDDTPVRPEIYNKYNVLDLREWDGQLESPVLSKLLQDIGLRVKNKSNSDPYLWLKVIAAIVALILIFVAVAAVINYLHGSSDSTSSASQASAPVESPSSSSETSANQAITLIGMGDGLNFIFGVAVPVDVERGIAQLNSVIERSRSFDAIASDVNTRIKQMTPDDYQEISQRLRLLKDQYPVSTKFVEGIIAGNGFAETPCRPNCGDVANRIAADLTRLGRSDLATLVSREARPQPVKILLPTSILGEGLTRELNGKGLLGGRPGVFEPEQKGSMRPLVR